MCHEAEGNLAVGLTILWLTSPFLILADLNPRNECRIAWLGSTQCTGVPRYTVTRGLCISNKIWVVYFFNFFSKASPRTSQGQEKKDQNKYTNKMPNDPYLKHKIFGTMGTITMLLMFGNAFLMGGKSYAHPTPPPTHISHPSSTSQNTIRPPPSGRPKADDEHAGSGLLCEGENHTV